MVLLGTHGRDERYHRFVADSQRGDRPAVAARIEAAGSTPLWMIRDLARRKAELAADVVNLSPVRRRSTRS